MAEWLGVYLFRKSHSLLRVGVALEGVDAHVEHRSFGIGTRLLFDC